MKISRAAIKQNAKTIISSTKPSPILVGLAYLGITMVLQFLSYGVSGELEAYMNTMEQVLAGNLGYIAPIPQPTAGGFFIGMAISLMLLMMSIGFTIYSMNVCRFFKSGVGNLFDGFVIFFKVVWLHILMFIFVYLWSLLLIIPGIVALYRYRMALYIMIDNPQLGALDCIRASKQMMDGRKGELFVLDLSFLGWWILTMVPFVIIWVAPYTSIVYTNYYLALRDMPKPDFGGAYQ